MARIVHHMKTGQIPKADLALLRRLGLPLPSSSDPKKKRATPRNARSMPKVGPKAPLVTKVYTAREVLDVLPQDLLTPHGQTWLRDRGCKAMFLAPVKAPGWRIRWDEVSVSQNVLMRKYANHHAYARLVATWEKIFSAAMREGGIPKATGRRRLTITRYVRDGKYLLDRVNLAGGFKPYLDAAVRAGGLILDDREGDLDDHYKQAIDPDERVEILVEDI